MRCGFQHSIFRISQILIKCLSLRICDSQNFRSPVFPMCYQRWICLCWQVMSMKDGHLATLWRWMIEIWILLSKQGLFADNTIFRSHGKLYLNYHQNFVNLGIRLLAFSLISSTKATSLGRKSKIWCRLTICVIVEQMMALLTGRIQVLRWTLKKVWQVQLHLKR